MATRTARRTPKKSAARTKANARPAAGRTRRKRPIRVAIIGVGNCASSLVQGVHRQERRHTARQAVVSRH